jgi:hypothetical protein
MRLSGRERRLRADGNLGRAVRECCEGRIYRDRLWLSQLAFWHTFGMVRFGGLGCRGWFVGWGMRFLLCVLGLQIVWGGAALAAQDGHTSPDEPIHTLHVYTNLIQIPTVVLGSNRERFKTPIPESKFSVSIDSGPWFRATHVRQEGDDPISLSILLDARGPVDNLLPKIDAAIAALAPLSLQPRDHVSIYALECSLVQSLNDAPARPDDLKRAVDLALQSWTYRRQNKRGSDCKPSVQLWDAMAFVIEDLHRLPGRHVLLAVTDGSDKGSRHTWDEVRSFAQATGVAIFGLAYAPIPGLLHNQGYEDVFNSVCELSGGMVFTANESYATKTALKQLIRTLRERYIVEFPRPSNSTVGRHDLLVTIEKSNAFIRPAGISVPIADPALLADPTTIRTGPSQAPVEGTRRVLTKPQ